MMTFKRNHFIYFSSAKQQVLTKRILKVRILDKNYVLNNSWPLTKFSLVPSLFPINLAACHMKLAIDISSLLCASSTLQQTLSPMIASYSVTIQIRKRLFAKTSFSATTTFTCNNIRIVSTRTDIRFFSFNLLAFTRNDITIGL